MKREDLLKIREKVVKITEKLQEVLAESRQLSRQLQGERAGTIIDSYCIGYLEGLLGGGQIMLSFKDVEEDLNDELLETSGDE